MPGGAAAKPAPGPEPEPKGAEEDGAEPKAAADWAAAQAQLTRVQLVASAAGERDRTARGVTARHLAAVNRLLRAHGQPLHHEPEVVREAAAFRCPEAAVPTAWFAYLQRFVAHVRFAEGGALPDPTSDDDEAADDEMLDWALASDVSSHVLCHGTEGYFVPVDFEGPPLFDARGEVPGGWVGSSQRLLDELVALCEPLGIEMTMLRRGRIRRGGGIDVSAEALAALAAEADTRGAYWVERSVWFLLYEAATWSVRQGSAVVLTSE